VISLSLTSSSDVVGVAVGSVDEVLAFEQVTTQRRHAEEITPLISLVAAKAGVELKQIEGLIVDVGPGRFTGLRVGVSTAIGLAAGLNINVKPVTSLQILAFVGLSETENASGFACVVDARRGEVFQQLFDSACNPISDPLTGDPVELNLLTKDYLVIGDGADNYPDHYQSNVIKGVAPRADLMLRAAENVDAISVDKLRPNYLREPDAVANIKSRQNESK